MQRQREKEKEREADIDTNRAILTIPTSQESLAVDECYASLPYKLIFHRNLNKKGAMNFSQMK
jgi:hypothetical protein